MGNRRLETFPVWELVFENLPDGAPRIATEKVKWDLTYQRRAGIKTRNAQDLPDGAAAYMARVAKRVYRTLGQSGYARLDFRLAPDGSIYLLESNPKPHLAYGEDFAESAHLAGIEYDRLIHRILNLGLRYHRREVHT
jgi:D-alanine-D-alanine ligase